MSVSPQNRHQLPQQQQQVSPQQALYNGKRVSVKSIVQNELYLEQHQHQQPPRGNSSSPSQSRKQVGFQPQSSSTASSQQWAQHALVPMPDKKQQQLAAQNKKKKKQQQVGRFSNPYELVKRAMASEENQRVESKQNLKGHLGQKTVRTRNLRFEQQQQQQRKSGGASSPVMLRSASQQPTSFTSPTQAQQAKSAQNLRGMVNACVRSEAARVFLTEEEARALSGGRVCYSVSQRTTAFGSTAPHTETTQEPFCLLAVNIARALVPGISHCAMVRRAAGLLSSPAWSQKLASGVSLLAHGVVNITLQQDAPPEEQKEEEEEPKKQEEEEKETTGDRKEEQQQQPPKEKQEQQQQRAVKSHVQWAMMHVPMDTPSLFVALYAPPAAEGLLPNGFEAAGGADGGGSIEELLRIQREKAEEEERRRQMSHENNFAHRFVGKVFHNIGLDSDDYDEEENDFDASVDDEQQQQQVPQILSSPPPVPPLDPPHDEQQQQQQQQPGKGEDAHAESWAKHRHEEYHNAGEFVDEVFDDLLGARPARRTDRSHSVAVCAASSDKGSEHDGDDGCGDDAEQQEQHGPTDRPSTAAGSERTVATRALSSSEGSPSSRGGGVDSTGLFGTISKLRFLSAAHRDVATQVCLAVETFLTQESHGRKVRRLVVCAHSTSSPMASDVVTALRARQVAKGQSRRVMLVTTQANIASSVPRRRLEGKMRASPSQSYQTQEQELLMLQQKREEEDQKLVIAEGRQQQQQRPGSGSSTRRTHSAGSRSGALTIVSPGGRGRNKHNEESQQQQQQQQPDGKFSEWSPDERANALRLFFARLCIPVPKLSFDLERRRGWRFVVMPECFAWAVGYFAPGAVLSYQSLEFPHFSPQQQEEETDENEQQRYANPPGLAPSIDDIIRHLWGALSNVEGCIDSVSGGASLEGFVLAATTLLAGLVSREVADTIWDEVFASKFTASIYPAGTPIPTPPPVCACCGAIGADYFSSREATFIRQMKAHAPAAMKPFLKKALQRPFDAVPQQRLSKKNRSNPPRRRGGSHTEKFFDRDAEDDDDEMYASDEEQDQQQKEAAAAWNRAFFAESFHPPFDVLARTNAQFLPPLTALFSSHVARTADTYQKQGVAAAATVRLRLQENLYRSRTMAETFS